MWRILVSTLFLVLAIGLATSAFSYEVKEVKNGGSISGVVTLLGPAPEPKAYNLITFPDPEYCGRISTGNGWRLLRDFLVNDQKQVKDVVVFIEDIEEGKAFAMSIPRVEARDCQFQPFTTIVRSGHGVEVINMDPVMHDIQAYETSLRQGSRVLFNSPLPFNHRHKRGDMHANHDHKPSESLVRQFHLSKGRKIFVMQCGFHAYMESWAIAVENPYYSFSDAKGQFSIHEIPPRDLPNPGMASRYQTANIQNGHHRASRSCLSKFPIARTSRAPNCSQNSNPPTIHPGSSWTPCRYSTSCGTTATMTWRIVSFQVSEMEK